MANIKTVYMITDLEGVAGIDDWDPRHRDYAETAKGVHERSEMQRLLTGEVNAAAEGLFESGVQELIVSDSHGAGRTILPEELISGIKIVRGVDRGKMMFGMTDVCDALVYVGMHAMANTENACLSHTMSSGIVYRINGREVGEMAITAYIAGDLGVPWIFTSGDLYACREAEVWVQNMVTAPVKEGISRTSAIHLAPVDARKLIKTRIQEAVQKADTISPLKAEPPVVMEIERDKPWSVELEPGIEQADGNTVRYTGGSMLEVYHLSRYGTEGIPEPGFTGHKTQL